MTAAMPSLLPLLPELTLALGAMALLMVGAFSKKDASALVSGLAVVVLAGAAGFASTFVGHRVVTMSDGFVRDGFAVFAKVLCYFGAAVALIMSTRFMRDEKIDRFEVPVLILLATLGMSMMISAYDLMSLYVGLELQSLALYIIAAIKRDSLKSTEAGLKYFVLGALSSGILLYGISLIYGFTGSTNFAGIAHQINTGNSSQIGLIFGLVFLLAGLAFKISAVPFHMWTPDVYEGAPTPITAFFAGAPKIAAMALLVRVVTVPFPDMEHEWRQIITFMAIASMVLGAFAAIGQTNIKRLMAYSSISHMGYALVGLAAASPEGVMGIMMYLSIYLAMTLGTFACILSMRRADGYVEEISDLAGLGQRQPMMAAALAMMMFSLTGIPPLAGFFGKWYVFSAAIQAGLYPLAVVGVIASVVGAFYYLRVVKVIYFDQPAEAFVPMVGEMRMVLGVSSLFVLGFVVMPGPLVGAAYAAARALLP
jgi:NADH-quinone oxidoreductase subunit N